MKKTTTLIFASLMFLGVEGRLYAAPEPDATITGHVIDESRNTLPGASVKMDDKEFGVVTDIDGKFRLVGLDAGNHTITVSYLGYEPVVKTIIVRGGEDTVFDIVMIEKTSSLDEVVVTSVFSEQRRAINQQKSNVNVSNVVSAEQTGKFPDSNIGDALKRISGINVQYDQGEARFGQIRGTGADLSSITVNGSRLPSAEGDIRCVQLDLIPTDMIQTIEVNKVVTPDQDGDAIGGSVNLITKGAPYSRFVKAFAGSGYNWISRKPMMNFGVTYGDRFFGRKLGVTASASYQNSPSGSYNTEFIWEKDDSGNPYINDYQIRRYYVTRERQSYSLSIDYNFNSEHSIYFKGLFNNRNDWENRYRTTLKDITPEGKATVRVQTKAGTPDNRNARLEQQQTMDFTLGGNHHLGIFDLDWKGGYAMASEKRPNERYIDYQLKKQNFDMDISNMREPFAIPRQGSTMTLNEKFSLKELTQQQEEIREEDLKFSFDLKTELGTNTKLKFGAKVVNKTKRKEIDFYEYTPLDEYQFATDAFSHITDQYTRHFMPSDRYNPGLFVDKQFVGSLDLDNASQFKKAQVAEELAGNYKARETVTSGYFRFDTNLLRNLQLTAGLRMENTALRYIGRIYDDETDIVSVTTPESSSYMNFLPSLLLKWNVNDDFVVRGSYTKTISRPKYSALVPGMSISRSDNEVKIGNTKLKPTLSHNLDFNGEYYFKSIGLVNAGLFYKRIQDFIVDEVQFNGEYAGQIWNRITQPKNAGNADLFGVELSYQRDFGFIASVLRCIGFYGTYTYSYSRINNFNFEGREDEKGLRLPGSPEHTANASLFFEKSGVSVRLSYNYASAFVDEMGASSFYDRYYDSVNYLDFNASYTFGKKIKFTVYAEANNLLNQPLRYYQGQKEMTMQAEYYGIKLNGGIKISF